MWCALFSCNIRFEIRAFDLLPTISLKTRNGSILYRASPKQPIFHGNASNYLTKKDCYRKVWWNIKNVKINPTFLNKASMQSLLSNLCKAFPKQLLKKTALSTIDNFIFHIWLKKLALHWDWFNTSQKSTCVAFFNQHVNIVLLSILRNSLTSFVNFKCSVGFV